MRIARALVLIWLAAGLLSGCTLDQLGYTGAPVVEPDNAVVAADTLNRRITALARDLVARVPPGVIGRVAVLDPVGPGKHLSEFSSYLTDKLIQRFVALGAFTGVLERRRLHDILVQQQLELSAHFDPKTVAPLGKKLGVDGLVIGRVSSLGGGLLEISLKLVKVKTGEVLAASEVSIAASGVVASMLRRPLTATVRVEVEPAGAVGTASVGGVRRELLAGGAVFRQVPQGPCVVSVNAPGYAAQSRTVYLTGDRTYGFELKPLAGSAAASVDPGHWLWLTVRPAGAQVSLDGAPVSLDSQGKLSLRLPPGRHRLVASAAGHDTVRKTITLEADFLLTIDLPATAGAPAVVVAPPASPPRLRPARKLRLEFSAVYRQAGGALRELRPGSVLASGTAYALSFQPSLDCWVYIFQVDGAGRFFRLFPARAGGGSDGRVKARQRYWVPSPDQWLFLDQVPGREKIFVVVSRQPNRELRRLYRRLREMSDPVLRRRVARDLLARLGSGGTAGVQPYGARRVSYGGGVFEVTEQVLLASGAEMVYSIGFMHR